MLVSASCHAQLLQADWIAENDRQIAAVRKTDVRIIVLDERGHPQPGVPVTMMQTGRALPIGFAVGPEGFDGLDMQRPVWRVFNAISLERIANWARTQPEPSELEDLAPVMFITDEAQRQGMTVRWGGIVSADPAKNPDWLVGLEDRLLEQMVDLHVAEVLGEFGPRVDQFDVYTDNLSHDFLESRLGMAMVRRLYEQAKALAPDAHMCIRFSDALTGQRLPALVRAVTAMHEQFIPTDLIALEQRVEGKVNRTPLKKALEWIGRLGRGVVVVDLEVGGQSEAGALVNLETLLRVLFADANVQGLWLGAMHRQDIAAPHAALLDDEGNPTPLGELFDQLFYELWRTDELLTTDELGNARASVFTGTHRLSAVLPDGRMIDTTVWIPKSPEVRVILLQPVTRP